MRRNRTPEEQAAHDFFEGEQRAILAGLPPEFHGPIADIAWDIGHAHGYDEVLIYVRDFAEKFERPIKDYTKRITTPSVQ